MSDFNLHLFHCFFSFYVQGNTKKKIKDYRTILCMYCIVSSYIHCTHVKQKLIIQFELMPNTLFGNILILILVFILIFIIITVVGIFLASFIEVIICGT